VGTKLPSCMKLSKGFRRRSKAFLVFKALSQQEFTSPTGPALYIFYHKLVQCTGGRNE
jgi:hypothetical protein